MCSATSVRKTGRRLSSILGRRSTGPEPSVGQQRDGARASGRRSRKKNHLGSRSERGTRVAALFYSLLETANLCDLEPRDYLAQAARQALKDAMKEWR